MGDLLSINKKEFKKTFRTDSAAFGRSCETFFYFVKQITAPPAKLLKLLSLGHFSEPPSAFKIIKKQCEFKLSFGLRYR